MRKLFTLSIVLTSVATFVMGTASSVFTMKAARALLGLSEGPLNIGIVTTINRWFPPQEKGLATGIFMSSIKFAPALVPPICAAIILLFGWRQVFYLFALPGFILAVLWFWLVKNDPRESSYCSQAEVDYIYSKKDETKSPEKATGNVPRRSMNWLDRIIRSKQIQPLDTNRKVVRSW